MSVWVSMVLCVFAVGAVGVLSFREYLLYRQDQSSRTEIYPYTKHRFLRRMVISSVILMEALLLFVLSFTLRPERPIWFVIYVTLVIGGAIALFILALLDLRETKNLLKRSRGHLLQEFVQELKNEQDSDLKH